MKPHNPSPRGWQYWLRLVCFAGLALGLGLISLPAWYSVPFTLALLYAPCTDAGTRPVGSADAWEEVTLQARAGGSFRGYFMLGTNGATVIIPPAGSDGRNGSLPTAEMLLRHGYTVFTYESRPCADIRPFSLGYQEVDEVADVLDYLLSRPDVDPHRIGIRGFSSAGATSIMATARLPALRAVVAEGGYGDFIQNGVAVRPQANLIARLFWTGFRGFMGLTYRLVTGHSIRVLSPVSVIRQIAPRPILLIYGAREPSLAGGRQQKAAAGGNAVLWVVEGAGHGQYLQIAPDEYESRVVGFFDEALK
jgi:pimeloyl-ACP methyl ester carboxylesterase